MDISQEHTAMDGGDRIQIQAAAHILPRKACPKISIWEYQAVVQTEMKAGKFPSMQERKQINFYTKQASEKKVKKNLLKKLLCLINRTRN